MQQIVTMTTESVESVSSTQTIISLISSEEEESEDFDFHLPAKLELESLKTVSKGVASPETECFAHTTDFIQNRIDLTKTEL